MTKWLDIAWADQGVHEIAGPSAEPSIVAYFRDAGRPDVTSDEVPWCAGFLGACLSRAGVPPTLPKGERLLARAYLKVGTPLAQPRAGCIAVMTRGGDPRAGHVGFVVGWTDTHIALLGGNQADAVNVRHFPRGQVLGYRWPLAGVTPADVERQGSRIAKAAGSQSRDAGKAGGATMLPQPPEIDATALVGKGQALQGTVESAIGFLNFLSHRWPWLMGAFAVYWIARIGWRAGWIRIWRAEDETTGGRGQHRAAPQPNDGEAAHAFEPG